MKSDDLVNEGRSLLDKMEFEKARQLFREALQYDSKHSDALSWLALLSFLELNKEEGFRYLEQALRKKPPSAMAVALQGIAYLMDEEYNEAIGALQKAKAVDPNLQMIYSNLARSYRKIGKLDLAEEAARRAIELNPNDFLARSELSNILGKTGRVKEGIAELLECIRINPFYLKAYLALGAIYKKAGHQDLVMGLFANGLKQNPKAYPLREQVCDIYASHSDFRNAYLHAVELVTRRNFFLDYLRLGVYATAIGAPDKAKKAFRKAVDLSPAEYQDVSASDFFTKSKLQEPPAELYPVVIQGIQSAQQVLEDF
jgi:tetratricopeptide (TPR) repeat protein